MNNLFTLHYSCLIDASIEEVCAFHTDTRNLPLITPPAIGVTIVSSHNNTVVLDIKKFGFTTRWKIAIEKNCPSSIVDVMLQGPFASFRHERRFIAKSEQQTLMEETIYLASPIPFLQTLFFKFVKKDIRTEVKISELSSGEKILIALAFALYNNDHVTQLPKILLLDETDASLHPSMSKQYLHILKNVFVKKF